MFDLLEIPGLNRDVWTTFGVGMNLLRMPITIAGFNDVSCSTCLVDVSQLDMFRNSRVGPG